MSTPTSPKTSRPPTSEYVAVAAIVSATVAALISATRGPTVAASDPRLLLEPVFAMVLLTAIVLLLTAVVRNVSVLLGKASVRYYEAYASEPPPDWIERPARTFNNLMQLPVLFYVACGLMLVTRSFDQGQVSLAWIFVVARVLHAVVYIVWNRVAFRFAVYLSGFIALGVLWVRFAMAVL